MYKPLCLVPFLFSIPAFAGTIVNFSGTFSQDDNMLEYQFTIAASSTVTIESFGYGGDGAGVPAGGFATVLSLFGPIPSADPNLLGSDEGGVAPAGCGARLIDSQTGFCFDALLTGVLSPGTYVVTLTENDNTPNGPGLLDGFSEDGTGNFTGINQGFQGASFLDPFGNQRTPNFDFSISGADSAVQLPEPSTLPLLIAGSALLAGLAFFKKIRRSN